MNRQLNKSVEFGAILIIGLFSCISHAELRSLWQFDSRTAKDSYGNNHGVVHGEPNWIERGLGYALHLDGVDDYIDCGVNIDPEFCHELTIAAWVKTTDSGNNESNPYIYGGSGGLRHLGDNEIEFRLKIFNVNELSIEGHDRKVDFDVDNSLNNEWHHLVGTYDGREMRIYVDGKLVAASIHKGFITLQPQNFNIGRNPRSKEDFYNGLIDDIHIFDNAITKEDVKQLYKNGNVSHISKIFPYKLIGETEAAVTKLEEQEVIAFIEKKISEYEILPSDVYVQLAKAKEVSGSPIHDVVAAYKQSVTHPRRPSHSLPATLYWLSNKIPENEYICFVKECINNSDAPYYNLYHIARFFESKGNWPIFRLILDTTITEEKNALLRIQAITKGLKKNDEWANKLFEYCRSKPECTRYLFYEHETIAKQYLDHKNFQKASEIYYDIINLCGPNQQKGTYELAYYKCLFNQGKYESVIKDMNSFLKNNKATHRALISKSLILKGQAQVNLGNLDQAIDTFLTIMIEYPEVKEAPEAHFFVGYCYMLQGKFDEAAEAFNLVVENYSESSYVDKARSSMSRIKSMTE
jgi:TolA-binding protein